MTESLHRRRPDELNAIERLDLAMGRPVPNPPTDEEMRAYYAKLRADKQPARRRSDVEPSPREAPPDDGLNVVERLARAMGRPVPRRPTEEEWSEFQKLLRAAEDAVWQQRADRNRGAE